MILSAIIVLLTLEGDLMECDLTHFEYDPGVVIDIGVENCGPDILFEDGFE